MQKVHICVTSSEQFSKVQKSPNLPSQSLKAELQILFCGACFISSQKCKCPFPQNKANFTKSRPTSTGGRCPFPEKCQFHQKAATGCPFAQEEVHALKTEVKTSKGCPFPQKSISCNARSKVHVLTRMRISSKQAPSPQKDVHFFKRGPFPTRTGHFLKTFKEVNFLEKPMSSKGCLFPLNDVHFHKRMSTPQSMPASSEGCHFPKRMSISQQGCPFPQNQVFAQKQAFHPKVIYFLKTKGLKLKDIIFHSRISMSSTRCPFPQQGPFPQKGSNFPAKGCPFHEKDVRFHKNMPTPTRNCELPQTESKNNLNFCKKKAAFQEPKFEKTQESKFSYVS